jgi:hypothetical protein
MSKPWPHLFYDSALDDSHATEDLVTWNDVINTIIINQPTRTDILPMKIHLFPLMMW